MTAEKAIFNSLLNGGVTIVETIGYAGGSEVPVFTKTYSTTGTGAWGPNPQAAGDVAALLRYSTPDRSSKNHPIYCFNYFHAVQVTGGPTTGDTLLAAQRTAMGTYASSWITGFSDGTTNHIRSRPNGNAVTGSLVEPLVTHRDLPH